MYGVLVLALVLVLVLALAVPAAPTLCPQSPPLLRARADSSW